MKYATSEKVAMWLISHKNIVHNLNIVRLHDCEIDASYLMGITWEVYTDGRKVPRRGPIVELMSSHHMVELDLSNNPLFVLG